MKVDNSRCYNNRIINIIAKPYECQQSLAGPWLPSQSIFLVAVKGPTVAGNRLKSRQAKYCGDGFITCAFFLLKILPALIIFIMFSVLLGSLGMRKMGGNTTLVVGFNLLAIAVISLGD
ncbi:hypothetical protein DM02DRAFT_267960 [Periconia macrospinosa]|uniref:Uncharacterized protein n=1 Tax=Periconia macrospinosa TaxID=97972 RepID=A0A2V1DXK8_9PLEO|nr:hypothetical protein DM02DRAFT_267960 [Periconia macrospinosa]